LTHDGGCCAVNAVQGAVDVWDEAQKHLVRRIANEATAPGHWHVEMVRSLSFSDDGSWLIAPDGHDGGLRVVDCASGHSSGLVHESVKDAVPYFKGVAFARSACLVALIHPSEVTGKGPDGLEVWKIGTVAP
jgi:WD40 repeat protein